MSMMSGKVLQVAFHRVSYFSLAPHPLVKGSCDPYALRSQGHWSLILSVISMQLCTCMHYALSTVGTQIFWL